MYYGFSNVNIEYKEVLRVFNIPFKLICKSLESTSEFSDFSNTEM